MDYDTLLDKLLDALEGAESETALFAVLSALHAVISTLPDRELAFIHVRQIENVHAALYGAVPESETMATVH